MGSATSQIYPFVIFLVLLGVVIGVGLIADENDKLKRIYADELCQKYTFNEVQE